MRPIAPTPPDLGDDEVDGDREDAVDPLVGTRIDKYEIVRLVGRGGMGRVYEALNTAIQKRVAIKCIDRELSAKPEAVARFQREALAASAVDSPHIVQIFDAGEHDGSPYIVMELLEGCDLGALLAHEGRLDEEDALFVAAQVLKALHRAHKAGIVHRDLKPDNIFLVDREDEPVVVKLLDFGVSKIARDTDVPLRTLTRQGTVVGTPFYMSPEQAQALPDVDGRTDLYSVGAILYECLTGRPPHHGKSYEQVIVHICMHDAEDVRAHNPKVDADVAELIGQALAREREERFANARAMLEALRDCGPQSLAPSTPSSLRISSDALPTSARPSTEGSGERPRSARSSGQASPRFVSAPPASSRPNELADTVSADSHDAFTPPDTESAAASGADAEAEEQAPEARESSVPSTLASPTPAPEAPARRPAWAIGLALVAAVAAGMWLGRQAESPAPAPPPPSSQAIPASAPKSVPATATTASAPAETSAPAASAVPPPPSATATASASAVAAPPPPAAPRPRPAPAKASAAPAPAPPPPPAPPAPPPTLELMTE